MKCDICKNLNFGIGFIETKCCYESVVEAHNNELRTLVSELRIELLKKKEESFGKDWQNVLENNLLRKENKELRIESLKLRYEVTALKKGTRLKFQEEANLKLRFQISKLENKNQEGRDTIDVLTKKNEELKDEAEEDRILRSGLVKQIGRLTEWDCLKMDYLKMDYLKMGLK